MRNRERAELLFINEVKVAKTEVLIASSSLSYLEHLAGLGLLDSLEQTKSRGAEILILCPEIYPLTSGNDLEQHSKLLLDIKRYAKVRNVAGQIKGSILVVDNSKVLSISEEGIDALAIYSDNKSLVNNFGSLFEALWMEKELFQDLVRSKNELLKSNEQLKVHDKMQKEFINIAAHELRTPIQPILGTADLIESKFKSGKEKVEVRREDIEIIIRNASRLERLSSDILEIAKIESGLFTIHKEQFNIKEIISQALLDAKTLLREEKNVDLHYEPKYIIVYADKGRISQVINNLLSNAIKFTEKGDIYLLTDKTDNYVIISVKDTGTGIDEEIMPKLFTKFATKSEKGIGLGLFLSKNIIEAHNGKIWVENNPNGKGATFTFVLPVAES